MPIPIADSAKQAQTIQNQLDAKRKLQEYEAQRSIEEWELLTGRALEPKPTVEETRERTGWDDRYTELPVNVLREYNPEQVLVMVVIRRHLHSRRNGRIAKDVRVEPNLLSIRVGMQARTLKKWLSPRGCLSDQMRLRLNTAGSPIKIDGKWVIDVKCVWGDEEKTHVIKGGFVKVPHNWLWINPWQRRNDVSSGALWAACVIATQARSEDGKCKSVTSLSNMWSPVNKNGNHAGRELMYRRLNDAEDAGLISVTQREVTGRKPAIRVANQVTLPPSERTSLDRCANESFTARRSLW